MPTKRSARKKTRSAKAKKVARGRATSPSRKQAAPRRAAKAAAAPKRKAATGAASRELAAMKARLEREKAGFEKRLSETVREIAQLRHHEARAAQLDRQLKERDELIAHLRTQLNDLRNREIVTPEDEEVQPSLALGSRSQDFEEFDEDVEPEEDDELI